MGMFEWQSSTVGGDDNVPERSVSPDFWIYWAVTIPLTLITLAGWATWWKIEEQRFAQNVRQAMRDKPPLDRSWETEKGKTIVSYRSGFVNAGP